MISKCFKINKQYEWEVYRSKHMHEIKLKTGFISCYQKLSCKHFVLTDIEEYY